MIFPNLLEMAKKYSQFDHNDQSLVRERSQLPMDYSALTLDHSDWKAMLPRDKQEVVWRSASLGFFLDQGKNCFLLGAKKVVSRCYWKMRSHPKSRFAEVAELIRSSFFNVEGRIKTQMLTPETMYAAYLVFGFNEMYGELGFTDMHTELGFTDLDAKLGFSDMYAEMFTEKCAKLFTANSVVKICYDEYDEEETRIVNFETSNQRADGWREIQVADFYVGVGGNGKVIVELLDPSLRGIIVEGIEFRPSKG